MPGMRPTEQSHLLRHRSQTMEGTFHRRELNLPAISFSSHEGKKIFQIALQEGHLEGYFHLAEHFITQGHPAFCGIGSLTMALNSLLLDPKRVWQGVWRWFDDSMLSCCTPLEVVRIKGITLPKLSCLARCNGASSTLIYGNTVTVEDFRQDVVRSCTAAVDDAAPHVKDSRGKCCGCQSCTTRDTANSADSCPGVEPIVSECCQAGVGRSVLVVAYNRRDLKQSGAGHFSPIGGYCAELDMVLIMDVARFKYPPHWVPLTLLHKAMQAADPDTGRCRGYLRLRALPEMARRCECADLCCGNESTAAAATGAILVDQLPAQVAAQCTITPTSSVDAVHVAHDTVMSHVDTLLQHSCPLCSTEK
jgi:glutathione gamma-glutamylcysteinyltransferase